MPPHPLNTVQTAALLGEASWLRSLAFSLVRDAELADDLAQQTWLRALQSPPSPDHSLRAWLRTVMKNLLRQEHRKNSRRQDRERLAATTEVAHEEQGANLLARVGMQQQLVEAVMGLEEPYRTTILMRFFEELTPTAIAAREQLPVSTVKTRLTRGLDRLRRQLDSDHGSDGKSWALALTPVLKSPAGHLPPVPLSLVPLGALFVNIKVILAVVVVLLGAGYFLQQGNAPVPPDTLEARLPETDPTPRTREAAATLATEDSAPDLRTDRQEVALPTSPAQEPEATTPEPQAALVLGRVVDLQGRPVGEVDIVASPNRLEAPAADSPVLGTSQADGRFEFPAPRRGLMRVRSERYTTVMDGVAAAEGSRKETILVVAPRIAVAGWVRDDLGVGIAGATVRIRPSNQMQANIPFILDYSGRVDFVAHTDGEGRFEFPEAPVFLAGEMSASAEGYSTDAQPSPTSDHGNHIFVLSRPMAEESTVTGVVLDPRGQRVEGATVGLGLETTTTDDRGQFSIFLGAPESMHTRMAPYLGELAANVLVATREGHQMATLEATEFDEGGRPSWPEHVVLRLGGEPLSIHGRVVNDEGEGLEGMRVWITDETFLGARPIEGRTFPEFLTVESSQAGLDSRWPYVETDGTGQFELTCLMDRTYHLVAMDPQTLVRTEAGEVSAGRQDVTLSLSHEDTWKNLRGKVVDRRGNPIAGAAVRVRNDAFQRKVQGRVVGTSHGSGAEDITDEDGRFEFELVPRQFAYFRVDHEDAIPVEIGRAEQSLREQVEKNPDELVLTIERRCHFQLELTNPEEADQYEVHNGEGKPLTLSEFHAGGRRDGRRFSIEGGRTNFVAVGDSATTLVLFLRDEEVRRLPVTLQPGEKPTLRP